MLEKAELIKEQKIALSQLEKVLHDKTTEMSDLLVEVDQVKKELLEKTEEIQNLNATISDRDEKILELSSLLDENEVRDKIVQLQNQLEQSQSEAKLKLEENLSLQDQCQSMQNELKEKAVKETEFQDKIKNLNGKLAEQENALEDFRTETEAKDSKFQVNYINCLLTTNEIFLVKSKFSIFDVLRFFYNQIIFEIFYLKSKFSTAK